MSRRYLKTSTEDPFDLAKEYKTINTEIGARIKKKRSSIIVKKAENKGKKQSGKLTQASLYEPVVTLENGKRKYKDPIGHIKYHGSSLENGKQKIKPYELAYIADTLDTTVESFFTDEPTHKRNLINEICIDAYREHVHDPALESINNLKYFSQISLTDYDFTGQVVSIYLENKIDTVLKNKGSAKTLNCIFLLIYELLANQELQPSNLTQFINTLEKILFNDEYSDSYINSIIQTIMKDSKFIESLEIIIPELDDIQDENDLNE